jgi:hypothetical protein
MTRLSATELVKDSAPTAIATAYGSRPSTDAGEVDTARERPRMAVLVAIHSLRR